MHFKPVLPYRVPLWHVVSERPWSYSCPTRAWKTGSCPMKRWRSWSTRRLETAPNGTTRPSTCSPVWASAWGWGTCGGSRTCARAMEEVGEMEAGRVGRFPLDIFPPKKTFALVIFFNTVINVVFRWMYFYYRPHFYGFQWYLVYLELLI